MALTTTTNYGFPKPAYGDSGAIEAAEFNSAQDAADAAIKSAVDSMVDAAELEVRLGGVSAPTPTELTYVDPTSSIQTQLNTKASATLDAVLADGEHDGPTKTLVAKVAIALGQIVMFTIDTTCKFDLIDVSSSTMKAVGICISAAANPGDNCTVLLFGIWRNDSAITFTPGAYIYRNNATDGGWQEGPPSVAGEMMQYLGYALAAHLIYFDPSKDVFTVS